MRRGSATPPDYQRLFEAAPALFLVLAPDPPRFTIVAASDEYLRAVNKRREQLLGRGVFEALPVSSDDPSAEVLSRASFTRVVETAKADVMAVQRHDLERPPGQGAGFEERYWSPINSPILGPSNEVLYVMHRVEDVTDYVRAKQRGAEHRAKVAELRTRAEQMEAEIYRRAQQVQDMNAQLRTANQRLSELDRLKTEFFSNVSHEFRTPLTLILGVVDGLLGGEIPSELRSDLEIARRNGVRLLRLVNALLDFSRLEAGRLDARFEPVDLGRLTADISSSFRSAAEQAGLSLDIQVCETDEPAYVDRGLWEKILLNLLSNAIKFTFTGGVVVRVQRVDAGWELSVEDTGTGIPEHELPHLFERFHRVPGARSRTHEGSGIGLSLVKELAKLHGGEVEVRSRVDQGSTFIVRVPAGKDHLPSDQVVERAAGPREFESWPSSSFADEAAHWLAPDTDDTPGDPSNAILIVDDNADMRTYLTKLLRPHWPVISAANGEIALRRILDAPPAVVLTDVMMPRMDGFELLRRVRADPRVAQLPVILLSARASKQSVVEGLKHGADDYLVKPFAAEELLARVRAHLELARLRRDFAAEHAALEARDEFILLAAHELRTPLGALALQQNLLRALNERAAESTTEDHHDKIARVIELASRQVDRLSTLVEQLLDTSWMAAGRLELDLADTDLREVARQVVARFERLAIEANCELSVHADAPVIGRWDPSRLDQVLSNLVANAVKYGHGAPVDVTVEDRGSQAAVHVADRGIGIHETQQVRIFDRFQRAVGSRKYAGLGLGLYLARELVVAHGGELVVRSAEGKGAVFSVILPKQGPKAQ